MSISLSNIYNDKTDNVIALGKSFEDLNKKKHKQFSSLNELNKFLLNLFNLLTIIKEHQNIQFFIYGGAIRDILLEKTINDIDISIFYVNNHKVFRSDEFHNTLLIISEFIENFYGFKIKIERKKLEYSLLKVQIDLPDKSYVNIDITSYEFKKISCDFTINNLEYNYKTGLNTLNKENYDVSQSIKDINSKTLRFVSDINTLNFYERILLIERSNKMLERGFKYDIKEYQKDPFLDISNENNICTICRNDDTNDKLYHICSTCKSSYHLDCANRYIKDCKKQNKDIIFCPNCRQ